VSFAKNARGYCLHRHFLPIPETAQRARVRNQWPIIMPAWSGEQPKPFMLRKVIAFEVVVTILRHDE